MPCVLASVATSRSLSKEPVSVYPATATMAMTRRLDALHSSRRLARAPTSMRKAASIGTGSALRLPRPSTSSAFEIE